MTPRPHLVTILLLTLASAWAIVAVTARAAAHGCAVRGTVERMQPSDSYKETFHVAGDAADPTGSSARGLAPGYRLTQSAAGHPKCLYAIGGQEMIVEIDVYHLPDQPMYLHLLCPHCLAREFAERNALRVTADQKQMAYEPGAAVPPFPNWTQAQMAQAFPAGVGGRLSVSTPFRCTWEIDPRYRERLGNICDFHVVIENNVIRPVGQGGAIIFAR